MMTASERVQASNSAPTNDRMINIASSIRRWRFSLPISSPPTPRVDTSVAQYGP